ncbi:two-component system sensor histidine kinase NtrB [Thiohalorhabdus methylotrophus]|uniref:histidine kinase n=1 Tax=Thiohalorhabdus methylotrophus TaxID=3242694 RepID=A0ABV4TVG9_9GAMM
MSYSMTAENENPSHGATPDSSDPGSERPDSQRQGSLLAYQRELELQNAVLHETQEALEAARNRYMDLYDSAPVGFVTLSPNGLIREANLTAAEMLGKDRRNLLGRPLTAFLAHGHSSRLFNHLRRVAGAGSRVTTEMHLRGLSGETLPVRVDTTLSEPQESSPTYLTTLTDISEQKRLEAENRRHYRELEQLSRAALVGEIASTLAHDLNQPLAAINNYAAAAQNDLSASRSNHERAREAIAKLTEQVGYAGDLIRSVREMLRPSDSIQETIDLNRVIEDSRRLVKKFAEEHQTALCMELAEDLPPVTGNATQLKQVVVNLAINAVEAYEGTGAKRPEVRFRTSRGLSGEILVEVTDQAGGMDEETRENLFKPFYSTKSEGLGMGLAICRTIVESHGGSLWAVLHEQGGTTMGFKVPGPKEDPDAAAD